MEISACTFCVIISFYVQSRLAITRLAITRIGYNAVGRGPRISAARGKWALQLTITL